MTTLAQQIRAGFANRQITAVDFYYRPAVAERPVRRACATPAEAAAFLRGVDDSANPAARPANGELLMSPREEGELGVSFYGAADPSRVVYQSENYDGAGVSLRAAISKFETTPGWGGFDFGALIAG